MKELLTLFFGGKWNALFYEETKNGWVQLFRYGFVGGGAFVVDFLTYCLLEWLGIYYMLAGIGSFAVGFSFNFLVSRWLIFCESRNSRIEWKELSSVLGISVVGLILTEVLLLAGVELLSLDYRLSKIVASVIVLFWNYAARKVFVYK